MITMVNESNELHNYWSAEKNADKLFKAKSAFTVMENGQCVRIAEGDTLFVESAKDSSGTRYSLNKVSVVDGEIVYETATVSAVDPSWASELANNEGDEQPAGTTYEQDVQSVIARFDGKLNTSADVHDFFKALMYELDLNFHPDTPFEDYIKGNSPDQLFSEADATKLNAMLGQCFEICEREHSDIYEIGLNIANDLMGNIFGSDYGPGVQESINEGKHVKARTLHGRINENSDRTVHTRDSLMAIEKWVESVWTRLEAAAAGNDAWLPDFFQVLEQAIGEDAVRLIDKRVSADYLHYNQNGATAATGGTDTYEFIENFEDIKAKTENVLRSFGCDAVQENAQEEPQYMSDDDIEKTFSEFNIREFKWDNDRCTGGFLDIDFKDNREDKCDNFIVYDSGKIAFDYWYPESVVTQFIQYIYNQMPDALPIKVKVKEQYDFIQ